MTTIKSFRGFRYRLYPTKEQARKLKEAFRICRLARNQILWVLKERDEEAFRHALRVLEAHLMQPSADRFAALGLLSSYRTALARLRAVKIDIRRMKDRGESLEDNEDLRIKHKEASQDHWRARKEIHKFTGITLTPRTSAVFNEIVGDYIKSGDLGEFPMAMSAYLSQANSDLELAFDRFFKGLGGYPSFKKIGDFDSLTFGVGSFKPERRGGQYNCLSIYKLNAKWGSIAVPGFPPKDTLRFRTHRPLDGDPKFVTITKRADEYYEVSFGARVEIEVEEAAGEMVGVDRGVAIPMMLSNGRALGNDQDQRAVLAARRTELQRRVSAFEEARKKAGFPPKTHNHIRALAALTKMNLKIANHRRDANHKATKYVVDRFKSIAIEDLSTKHMTKSAAGTVQKPGKNVAAKSGLNRVILDVGWYQQEMMLRYKAEARGGEVIAVDPKNTSRMCHECGHTSVFNRRSQKEFVCESCGNSLNADLNAARNIRVRGREVKNASVESPTPAAPSGSLVEEAHLRPAAPVPKENRAERSGRWAKRGSNPESLQIGPTFDRDQEVKARFLQRLRSLSGRATPKLGAD